MSHFPASTMRSTLLAVCVGGAALAAHAEEQPRIINSGPVTACQSALPVFDGQIRKRPLAVVNEGNGDAFVTCSLTTIGPRFLSTSDFIEYYLSYDGPRTNVDVTCTLVGGVQDGTGPGTPQFDTRTITLENGAEPDSFTYIPSQFNNDVMPAVVSFSCNLPPGAAIHDMYVRLQEEIGD